MIRLIRHIQIIAAVLLALASLDARAQEDYRFDAGGGVGMTGYLGDANTANLWRNPGFDVQGVFRYMRSPRIAFKTGLYVGTLSGNSAQMTNVFPTGETFKFSTTFFELSELFEFNFWNFGMGERYRKLRRVAPYICGGVGATLWTTNGYTGGAFTLPFGIGVKIKLKKRLNLGVEFLMKKTFADKLDGPALDDPQGIKSSFLKNTDWYSTLTISLTYEFSKRCKVCNYKE